MKDSPGERWEDLWVGREKTTLYILICFFQARTKWSLDFMQLLLGYPLCRFGETLCLSMSRISNTATSNLLKRRAVWSPWSSKCRQPLERHHVHLQKIDLVADTHNSLYQNLFSVILDSTANTLNVRHIPISSQDHHKKIPRRLTNRWDIHERAWLSFNTENHCARLMSILGILPDFSLSSWRRK